MHRTHRFLPILVGLVAGLLVSGMARGQVAFGGSGAGPIPNPGDDHLCGLLDQPLDLTFDVEDLSGAILGVQVVLELSHTRLGELIVTLIAPDDTSHVLFGRVGATDSFSLCGDGSDLDGEYEFTDFATGQNLWSIAGSLGPLEAVPGGDYRTLQSGPAPGGNPTLTFLGSAFAEVDNPNGQWTLRVVDTGGDPLDNGTGAVDDASLILTVGQRVEGVGSGAIPDGGPGCPAFGTARDVVFPVSSAGGFLLDVSVRAVLSHPWVGDLSAELFAPDGTSHVLFERVGTPLGTDSCFGEDGMLWGTYIFGDRESGSNLWQVAGSTGPTGHLPEGFYRTTVPGPYPSGPVAPVTLLTPAFRGLSDLDGDWILRLRDVAEDATGSVVAAHLTLSVSPSIFVDSFESGDTTEWTVGR